MGQVVNRPHNKEHDRNTVYHTGNTQDAVNTHPRPILACHSIDNAEGECCSANTEPSDASMERFRRHVSKATIFVLCAL